ncbi:alpha/beta fold hydrolase [Sphingomonas solaris]|uniref:Alpha/beta hydrolase n=1 Tax=Alterirhizorhabdus solaris TaxID=2529389 RepID=A0A558RB21_9SPHN|nr:alpha/beta hydrolase [Sphingomonas solaris]TVV76551.1 alpha/beta hydrolase [Sphingomonas solaris]
MTTIKRGFADVPHGQMHYRHAGDGPPLLMLHASPGSSRQLVGMIGEFAKTHRVLAPDTPGNGDSVAMVDREPTIVELAGAAERFLDAMEVDKVDLYGSHTGAAIAAELAIAAPTRINAVVLDGVSLMTPEELEDILANYAFPFPADREGAYLARVFQFCRDQYLFFPWYDRTRGGRRDSGLGSAADIHAWVVEVLKANETYHLNYRAAFKWDAGERLPLLSCPTLLTAAETDPLLEGTAALAGVVPGSRYAALPRSDAPDFADRRAAAIRDFLADHA